MVSYKKENFETDTLEEILELRLAGSLCDVTLTVGQDEIQAHRNVLAVGSEYFKTLFLGQFKEASMQNIDLSEVTDDVSDLEVVIDFLYTGEVNIDDENIEVLVKLSTYLLIESLKQFCTKYLAEQKLCLESCLQTYLLAEKYSLPDELRSMARNILITRLHDCGHIILNNKLTVSPDEVLFLTDEVFPIFCDAADALFFILKWLTDGMQDKKRSISVANQVFDTLVLKKIKPCVPCTEVGRFELQRSKCKDMFLKIKEELENDKSKDVEKFLRKSQIILMKTFPDALKSLNENQRKAYSLRATSSNKRKTCLDHLESESSSIKKRKHFDKETVVMTLVPSQYLVDVLNSELPDSEETKRLLDRERLPVFVLCCYVPSHKTWYQIQDFMARDPVSPLQLEFDDSCTLRAELFKEELVLKSSYLGSGRKVFFYNLKKKSWTTTILPSASTVDPDPFHSFQSFRLVAGMDCLYLIQKVMSYTDPMFYECTGEFFVGYSLSKKGKTWKVLFRTDSVTNHPSSHNEVQAAISSTSNELIFTQGPTYSLDVPKPWDGNNYVYVVNLSSRNPVPVQLHEEFTSHTERGLIDISIIQTQSHFYIVSNKYELTLFEYRFNSLMLTPTEAEEEEGEDEEEDETKVVRSLPLCFEICTHAHGETLWDFEGDIEHQYTALTEIGFTRNGKASIKGHTPPPFVFVTAMAVGEVSGDLLEQIAQGPVQAFIPCLSDKI